MGLLSFLVKGLLLALEVHPIMRSRVKFSGDEKWLEVGRDGVVGVAVSGMLSRLITSVNMTTITSPSTIKLTRFISLYRTTSIGANAQTQNTDS